MGKTEKGKTLLEEPGTECWRSQADSANACFTIRFFRVCLIKKNRRGAQNVSWKERKVCILLICCNFLLVFIEFVQ